MFGLLCKATVWLGAVRRQQPATFVLCSNIHFLARALVVDVGDRPDGGAGRRRRCTTMVKWHFHLSRGSCLQVRSILLCQLVLRDQEPFLYFSVVGFGRLG